MQSLNRGVPAASDDEPALSAVLNTLDGALVRTVGTLCTRVDVKRLEDVVQATRPHMDWVLDHQIVSIL